MTSQGWGSFNLMKPQQRRQTESSSEQSCSIRKEQSTIRDAVAKELARMGLREECKSECKWKVTCGSDLGTEPSPLGKQTLCKVIWDMPRTHAIQGLAKTCQACI